MADPCNHRSNPPDLATAAGSLHVKETTLVYFYRCTEQQLEEHLHRIADAGDEVVHVLFKGGRDYVLVCRKGGPGAALLTMTGDQLSVLIAAAVARGIRDGQRSDSHRTGVQR